MNKEEWIKQIKDVKVEWNTLDKAYWKLLHIANHICEEQNDDLIFSDLFDYYLTDDELNHEVQWKAENDGWGVVWEYLRPIEASDFEVFYSDGYTVRNVDEDDINWLKDDMIEIIEGLNEEKENGKENDKRSKN